MNFFFAFVLPVLIIIQNRIQNSITLEKKKRRKREREKRKHCVAITAATTNNVIRRSIDRQFRCRFQDIETFALRETRSFSKRTCDSAESWPMRRIDFLTHTHTTHTTHTHTHTCMTVHQNWVSVLLLSITNKSSLDFVKSIAWYVNKTSSSYFFYMVHFHCAIIPSCMCLSIY